MSRLRDDDRGSIPLAMLLILVSVTLSTLMTPMVLRQIGDTRIDGRRVHALHAAQAGLDVAMGQIRAADNGSGDGILARLPCGPFSGAVGVGSARYQVSIRYYLEDPRGKTDSWLGSNAMRCYTNAGIGSTPLYALLDSQGVDRGTTPFGGPGQRWLTATYIFQTTNQNIPGGLIHLYATNLCLDAGAGSPVAGTKLRVQACDASNPGQKWVYNPNLTISLSASKSVALPLGMCVDVTPAGARSTEALMQPCGPATKASQQWSINDSANYQGTTNGTSLNGGCLVVSIAAAGTIVATGNDGCGGPYNNFHTFSVEATVGAGAAGPATGQIVNFSQFGRCIDVTEFNAYKGYLIVWPCKQAPNAANVGWNQKFALPPLDAATNSRSGRITTTDDRSTPHISYCLHSPGSTTSGRYVTVVPCPANATPETTWTFYEQTNSYATSYVAVDYRGYCLAPNDAAIDRYTGGGVDISKIVMQVCDGSTSQKWNAPPNILRPFPLKDVKER